MTKRTQNAPAYPRRLGFVLPQELKEAIEESAKARMCSINSWIRQACLSQLDRERRGLG